MIIDICEKKLNIIEPKGMNPCRIRHSTKTVVIILILFYCKDFIHLSPMKIDSGHIFEDKSCIPFPSVFFAISVTMIQLNDLHRISIYPPPPTHLHKAIFKTFKWKLVYN